ncbi:unnamed protein product [Caenorhabditis auriculariae]|uniref:Uncharacterized protein n=1 Tax=Caenorhabditis auriculariae TaxID=2777116 RepID=A0A8S1HJY6_9PELO|nr:unnamed protein product [Caenorhabditis auriculariae]
MVHLRSSNLPALNWSRKAILTTWNQDQESGSHEPRRERRHKQRPEQKPVEKEKKKEEEEEDHVSGPPRQRSDPSQAERCTPELGTTPGSCDLAN